MSFPITLFTVHNGNATKSFIADEHGLPVKDNSKLPYMSRGIAKTVHLNDLSDLGEQFKQLTPNQCLGYGVMNDDNDTERVIIGAKHLRLSDDANSHIARTKKYFSYQHGKAIAYFDFDGGNIDWYENECNENKLQQKLTPEHAIDVLKSVIPELRDVQFLARYSVSGSFKSKASKTYLIPPKSFHLYFVVNDGHNIPLLKDLILKRLWLAGYGYIQLSKPSVRSGVCNRLVRCLIDHLVFQGERIDFAGGARYPKNSQFYQDIPEPILLGGAGALTIANIKAISDDEKNRFDRKCRGQKGDLRKEVVRIVKDVIKRDNVNIDDTELEKVAKNRIKQHDKAVLKLTDLIHFSNGKSYIVSDLLAMPLDVNGKHPMEEVPCADPDEPKYNGGICAYFNWGNGKPFVLSFAHGRRIYKVDNKEIINMGKVTPFRKNDDNEHEPSKPNTGYKQIIDVCNSDFLSGRVFPSLQIIKSINDKQRLFFIRNSEIVILERNNNELQIIPASRKRVSHYLARHIKYTRGDAGVSPPLDIIDEVMETALVKKEFPTLDRIITAPQYTKEGKLIIENGYHLESGLFLDCDVIINTEEIKPQFDNDANNLEVAKELIEEDLLFDFPFVSNADKQNAIAMLILPFVRNMIPGPTPLHLFSAPTAGTGKSLCNEIIAMVFNPTVAHITFSQGKNNDGVMNQKIFSALNSGENHVWFDNVTGSLESPELDAALTSTFVNERGYHTQKNLRAKNEATWSLTANNLTMTPDTRRRSIMSRLNRKSENPAGEKIEFKHPRIKAWVLENRADLITAVLTIVEHWIAEGCPKPKSTPLLGSFEQWRDVIGGIMETAGYNDLMGNLEESRALAMDDKHGEWVSFAEQWYKHYPNEWIKPKDLLDIVRGDEFNESIFFTKSISNKGITSSIGHKLKGMHETMFGELCILKRQKYGRNEYLIHNPKQDKPTTS